MLKKLLKYDLKWCYKSLLVFYILAIFFSISVRVVESFEQNLVLLIVDKICSITVIALLVNILINSFMINWARFVKNIYADESYLTHTLPVSKNKIYLSKILTVVITLITSFTVILGCISICCLNENSLIMVKQNLEQSAVYFDCSVFSLIAVTLVTIFFEMLAMSMSGILGIIIGHRSNNLKIVKSIIVGFIIYILLTFVSIGILFMVGLINPDIMSLFYNVEVSSTALKGMMLVAILVYAIYFFVMNFICIKLLNKGVNVD